MWIVVKFGGTSSVRLWMGCGSGREIKGFFRCGEKGFGVGDEIDTVVV